MRAIRGHGPLLQGDSERANAAQSASNEKRRFPLAE